MAKHKLDHLTENQILKYRAKIAAFSNSGQYKKAYQLARKLNQKYPAILLFEYLEAVFAAEDPRGLSEIELNSRYKIASQKLLKLTRKLHGSDPLFAKSVRNEYYWFSKQPYKQYRLGVEMVKKGINKSYYSQGVGSCELSYDYALKGHYKSANKWARISIQSWKKYFKIVPNWYNSYLFFAKANGILGNEKEMMNALKTASKISKMPLTDDIFTEIVQQVHKARKCLQR